VLTVIAVLAGADVVFPTGQGERGRRDGPGAFGAAVLLILIVARPGATARTGADRDDAFDRRE